MATEDSGGTAAGPGFWARLLGPLHPTLGLTPAERATVEAERVAKNIARTRVAAPIMGVLMLCIAVAMLTVRPATEAARVWQEGIARIDLITMVMLAACTAYSRGRGESGHAAWIRRHLGEVLLIIGVVVGAALVVNTLHYQFKMIAWVAVILLTSVLFHARPAVFFTVQTAGVITVIIAAMAATTEGAARLGHVTTAIGSVVIVMLVERISFAAFVRETVVRHQLAVVNRELEYRVGQQVREIVENTHRIELLNRQLAAKVAARSEELAAALRRLAVAEHGGETLTPGYVVSERFEIKYVLGVGGMGVVYAAIDRVADHPVALKVVRAPTGDVSSGVRFLQEATAAASLSHPAIVRVLHVDVTADGRLYQALELVEGQTLDACVDRGKPLAPGVVARLGATLADALAGAHAAGIVHRDVKPQNIMITSDAPGCRLLDFGLAKLRETLSHASLSEHGTVIGTPQFLAPEQIATPLSVTGAADVYALGTVLYLCVSGRLPFVASQPMQWLYAHVHDSPAPLPAEGEAGVPEGLRRLIERCLAKGPENRPTARELSDQLAKFADGLEAPTLDAWARTLEYVDTRPLQLGAIALPSGVAAAAAAVAAAGSAGAGGAGGAGRGLDRPGPAAGVIPGTAEADEAVTLAMTAPTATGGGPIAPLSETTNLRLTPNAPLATSPPHEATRE